MRRALRYLLIGVLLAACGLNLWWLWRVRDAAARASALIAQTLAEADPALDALPLARIDVLLAVEDPSFWANDGTDFKTPGQGWTTLTQGLAKRLYFTRFTPGFEKVELILIAKFALSAQVPKAEILKAALATAYLGEGPGGPVIGVAAGARAWFGKGLDALSDDEWLALVAMLIAPNALDPKDHAPANAARVARIKRLLAGTCTPDGWRDVWLQGCRG